MQVTVAVSGTAAVIKLQGRFDFNTHREFRENTDSVVSNTLVKGVYFSVQATPVRLAAIWRYLLWTLLHLPLLWL